MREDQHHRLFYLNAENGLGSVFVGEALKVFPGRLSTDKLKDAQERTRVFLKNLEPVVERLYTTIRVYDHVYREKDNQWVLDDAFVHRRRDGTKPDHDCT